MNPVSHYGQITKRWSGNITNFYAHRLAWERAHGPIRDGLTVDHRECSNRLCCNPAHLELVTLAENGRRGDITRWGTIGDENVCRHGHRGERVQTSKGVWYCRACNRERDRKRAVAGLR